MSAEPRVRPRGSVRLWDDPRRLGMITNALFALAGAIVIAWAAQALVRAPQLALHKLVVRGELTHLDRALLEEAFTEGVEGNFLGVDLAAVRARIEALPWVRKAEVHRAWPDRIEARIEEHVALARWADGGLVNTHGELFDADLDDKLPRFTGPEGTAPEIAERYTTFRDQLATINADLTQVTLTPRYAWRLRGELAPGRVLTIELGRDQSSDPIAARLARFVQAYPQTVARMGRPVESADLRYPNGFALRLAGPARVPPGATEPVGRRA